ncbi:phage virion morphogenesis protein [Oricola sp.]|uniref:phage virion morphogenesis protein n=1 Tax=Oricola sp. TaxID=1979950 RepID=UPI0025FE7C85|nr:phage virion morphogenesis protein [Oricola sp.]MCI5075553.1 phage virion morphogenesis protein [Oricola sp.]
MARTADIVIEDAAVNAAIARVAAAGLNTAPLMQTIEGIMLAGVQARFETQTAPDGTAWQRLSPRTAAKRLGRSSRRRGYENILRVTGGLYRSITGESDATRAEVGTNHPFAAVHQEGATINMPARSQTVRLRKVKGNVRFARAAHKRVREVEATVKAHTITIPARPYLGFSDQDRADILAAAERYFEAASEGGDK